ncbi:MAG: prephenate dehydrogenase/arogenate dehydrogenase family protein [Ignavibacteriae bacterium]|nr:prephenate dehydrogenase/arogenate dehydrogenase family protein [Ignavibacteriota bacterium]NOG98211.1 prephenate dehydrogenase/arogenate dehydrogenase family protein [Ignavibacteriota bacterium]
MQKIAIIGLGLIGGSIAKALKQSDLKFEISGFDKKRVADQAINEKVIDKKLNVIEEALEHDVIFVCLPVTKSIEVIEQLAPVLHNNTILTDVCSIKGKIKDVVEKSGCKALYIGGHPMTGKEKGGYENSDPLLFENSTYIINDDVKDNPKAVPFFNLIKSMGAKIYFVDADLHDRIVANVSHLPQMLSVALVNNISLNVDGIKYTDFAAGGFRDMTRIASSDFNVWESIIDINKNKIIDSIDNFQSYLSNIKKKIIYSEFLSLAEEFENARFNRDEIPKDTKGFLTPLHDLFVFVSDVPGIISKISTALFEKRINIKDIELLKIREGTGGTFRLSFDNENDVKEAKVILEGIGFETKE